jgi:hypothetical protein
MWFTAFAYVLMTVGVTAILMVSFASDEPPEMFVSGDKDQDNILGDGLCPPKSKKPRKGSCDPAELPRKMKKTDTCLSRLEKGANVAPFDSTEVAAQAADAKFKINDILRGDGACLKAVAERAEEDEDIARAEIEATDGGALMSRLVEYRNMENLMFHCKLR